MWNSPILYFHTGQQWTSAVAPTYRTQVTNGKVRYTLLYDRTRPHETHNKYTHTVWSFSRIQKSHTRCCIQGYIILSHLPLHPLEAACMVWNTYLLDNLIQITVRTNLHRTCTLYINTEMLTVLTSTCIILILTSRMTKEYTSVHLYATTARCTLSTCRSAYPVFSFLSSWFFSWWSCSLPATSSMVSWNFADTSCLFFSSSYVLCLLSS